MKNFDIADGNNPSLRSRIGQFDEPEEAIQVLNDMLRENRFRHYLKNGSAILEESKIGAAKNAKPTNYTVTITGENADRVAKLGPKTEN